MKNETGFKWKLGMFVTIGFICFVAAVYIVGKSKNLFGNTIHLQTVFKNVNGLEVGNNVRFSGINVGTIDGIQLINDTSVKVEMVIRKDVQQFIKKDAGATIGSEGLMGDKVLVITPGTIKQQPVNDNDILLSSNPIETEQIIGSLKSTADNAKIITDQLSQFVYKMNNGNGALSKLLSDEQFSSSLKNTMVNLDKSSNEFAKFTTKMNNGKGALGKLSDESFGNKLDSTMSNLQAGTKGLSENMEAAKSNFLLRGFFKKKEKAEAQRIKDSLSAAKKTETLRLKDSLSAAKKAASSRKDSSVSKPDK